MVEIPSLPRIPGLPDPLRRIRMPEDFEAVTTIGDEHDPAAAGVDERALDRIWSGAIDLYRSGVHPAVQVCVRRHGVVVLDRAIGHARGNGPDDREQTEKVLATPETPFLIYSGSKAVTAFVVHLLADRGVLSLEQPVADYVPEYGDGGKAEVTIGHVLAHRAGVPTLPREAYDLDRLRDRDFILASLSAAKPLGRPGEFLAYHAVSGGFILREVVQRATGMDIQTVLAEEVREPLRFRWTGYGVKLSDIPAVAEDYVTGAPVLPPVSQLVSRALGVG